MTESKKAYPLSWPESWPRTARANRRQGVFLRPYSFSDRHHSMQEAVEFLGAELGRLGATGVILSTNVELRIDGTPYRGRKPPDDSGAAVYFNLKGKPAVMACDKWRRVEDNVWAIAKHIEALRGQARWGVGSVEQAFRGYLAIPERTGGSNWWETLGVPINASKEQIVAAYRLLVKKHHPDNGGDAEMFIRLTQAFDQALQLHQGPALTAEPHAMGAKDAKGGA